MKAFKVLGFSDDITFCTVCGKNELKGTYALEDVQTGDIVRAGSSCGAKMAGWTVNEFKTKYKKSIQESEAKAYQEYKSSQEYKEFYEKLDWFTQNHERLEKLYYNALRDKNGIIQNDLRIAQDENHKNRMNYLRNNKKEVEAKKIEIEAKYGVKISSI